MNIWFTSDTHFGHGNIIKYCGRPFKDKREMDLVLIRKWNERVKDEDLVFHLGDFCFSRSSEAPDAPKGISAFEYYKNQLKGTIVFIEGNHDKHNKTKTPIQSIIIKYGGKFINLTHRPEYAEGKYDFNFVGHVHQNWKFQQKTMDCNITTLINVGVDVWNFYPVTYGEIISKLSQWRKENEKPKL